MHAFAKMALVLGFGFLLQIGESPAADGLPDVAEAVLLKMEAFEEQTLLEAQVKIETKRREVVRYLEKQLDEVTKSGDLDGGIAIRDEIKRLKALPAAKPQAMAKEEDSVGKEDNEEAHVIVGRWAFADKDGTELVREFTPEGKCVQYRKGRREWALDYEVVNSREVDVLFLGALKFRHEVRGNDTLKTKEPDAIAVREEVGKE